MAIPEDDRPSGMRVIAAFLAAAFASVTALIAWIAVMEGVSESVLGFALFAYLFGLPVALAHIVLLAAPIYLVMRPRWHVRWWSAALAGYAVAALPVGSLSLADGIHGSDLRWALLVGLLGAAGGLAFWALVRQRTPPPPADLAERFR